MRETPLIQCFDLVSASEPLIWASQDGLLRFGSAPVLVGLSTDAGLSAYLDFRKPLATGRIDPWDELPPNLRGTEIGRALAVGI
jgi:hypothetical protein